MGFLKWGRKNTNPNEQELPDFKRKSFAESVSDGIGRRSNDTKNLIVTLENGENVIVLISNGYVKLISKEELNFADNLLYRLRFSDVPVESQNRINEIASKSGRLINVLNKTGEVFGEESLEYSIVLDFARAISENTLMEVKDLSCNSTRVDWFLDDENNFSEVDGESRGGIRVSTSDFINYVKSLDNSFLLSKDVLNDTVSIGRGLVENDVKNYIVSVLQGVSGEEDNGSVLVSDLVSVDFFPKRKIIDSIETLIERGDIVVVEDFVEDDTVLPEIAESTVVEPVNEAENCTENGLEDNLTLHNEPVEKDVLDELIEDAGIDNALDNVDVFTPYDEGLSDSELVEGLSSDNTCQFVDSLDMTGFYSILSEGFEDRVSEAHFNEIVELYSELLSKEEFLLENEREIADGVEAYNLLVSQSKPGKDEESDAFASASSKMFYVVEELEEKRFIVNQERLKILNKLLFILGCYRASRDSHIERLESIIFFKISGLELVENIAFTEPREKGLSMSQVTDLISNGMEITPIFKELSEKYGLA